MIGLSLSFCIQDILSGAVAQEQVEYIITSTMCSNKEEFLELVNEYMKVYWQDDPVQARLIAMRLWNNGQILQPRLQGGHGPIGIPGKHWTK